MSVKDEYVFSKYMLNSENHILILVSEYVSSMITLGQTNNNNQQLATLSDQCTLHAAAKRKQSNPGHVNMLRKNIVSAIQKTVLNLNPKCHFREVTGAVRFGYM